MKLLNNYLNKYSIIIFAISTFLICFSRTPFWDETHAFDIACLNVDKIFELASREGHTFLWYLILKPFSCIDFYPYPMFIINWLFCLFAIFILWKRAPFSPIIKAFITFSCPFLLYFAPVARCYSVGIFFLFLICAYYPFRFKRPFMFTFFIVICANTSLMAAVGCFWIGLIYIFEILQKYFKRTFKKPVVIKIFLIFLFCFMELLIQFILAKSPETVGQNDFLKRLINFVIVPYAKNGFSFLFHLISSLVFYFLPVYLFKNSKKAFVFALGVYLTLSYVFIFKYHGSYWNHYFYYIYFIVLFWIFKKDLYKSKFLKFSYCLILFFMLFPFVVHDGGKIEYIYSSKSKKVSELILADEKLKHSKLYVLEWWSDIFPGASVYLYRDNVIVYDVFNRNRRSYESLKDIFNLKNELIDFDEFYKNAPRNFYILSMGSLFEQRFINLLYIPKKNGDFIFKTKKSSYLLKRVKYEKDINFSVYQVVKL